MNVTEIVLLIIGGLFFAVSFFLPDGHKKEEEKITEEEIKALIDKEMEKAKVRIDDIVDETVNYSIEKTERALERLSNEKIMAVDEYSETVLKKINDNHNEAVFLYDMLNDKDEKLKNTTEELKVSKTELEIEKQQIEDRKKEAEKVLEAAKAEAVKAEAVKAEAEMAEAVESKPVKTEEKQFIPFEPEKLEIVDGVAVPVARKEPANQAAGSKGVVVSFESDNDGRKNSNEMIRKLHEEGKSNMQIAKELGLGVGEVKLVIDLFATKKK